MTRSHLFFRKEMLVSGGRVHGLLQKVMVAGRAHSGGLSPEREKRARKTNDAQVKVGGRPAQGDVRVSPLIRHMALGRERTQWFHPFALEIWFINHHILELKQSS